MREAVNGLCTFDRLSVWGHPEEGCRLLHVVRLFRPVELGSHAHLIHHELLCKMPRRRLAGSQFHVRRGYL